MWANAFLDLIGSKREKISLLSFDRCQTPMGELNFDVSSVLRRPCSVFTKTSLPESIRLQENLKEIVNYLGSMYVKVSQEKVATLNTV